MKPSRSGDISPFSIEISKEAVKQPYCLAKYVFFIIKNTHTSCVYFDIKFSGLASYKYCLKANHLLYITQI